MPVVVQINTATFIVRGAEAIERLRTDIVDAVRAGGALVTVGESERAPELLITPATRVRIDTIDEPNTPEQGGGAGPDRRSAPTLDYPEFEVY